MSDLLPTCSNGHTVCVEARWAAPPTSDDNAANRMEHPIYCWGLHVIGFFHDGWKQMVTRPEVVEDLVVRLTADLVASGVDLSMVEFTGRGLDGTT